MKLENRAAVITGGASGIGEAIGKRFAEEGAAITLVDVDSDGLQRVAGEIEAAGGKALPLTLDVRDEAQITRAVDETRNAYGHIDIAVNCAIKMAPGPLLDLSFEDWEGLIRVGLHGTFLMCREVARAMIDEGHGGTIINLSSNGGLAPYTGAGAYSTCKVGVIMLSKQAAQEWAQYGIRVNAICPAHVETPLTAYLKDPEIRKGREDVTPLGRVGQPEDVVAGALYLASDDASWVTSSALVIDGGLTDSLFTHIPGRKWS